MPVLRESSFTGCLLGGACGDALGQPIEAFPPDRLHAEFGEIRDFMPGDPRLPMPLGAGQWTDDTQMTLDIARSIIRCGKLDPADVAREFVREHETEGIRFSGHTIKYSLIRLRRGVPWDQSGMDDDWTQSNGAAMRIAAVGLLACLRLDRLPEDVRLASMITHKHPEAIAGARAVAFMVTRAAAGTLDPATLIAETIDLVGECDVVANLRKAEGLLSEEITTRAALKKLGTTPYIVHTTAAAAYCFLKTPHDLERTVIDAVMGGNDADTTGAIAGAISGAFNGEEAIPTRWRDHVERGQEIRGMAQALFRIVNGEGG